MRTLWSPTEDAVLKIYKAAPKGHRLAAIAGLLPGRSCNAIVTRIRYIRQRKGYAGAAAITAFLEAAAEQGWHIRPDEATK